MPLDKEPQNPSLEKKIFMGFPKMWDLETTDQPVPLGKDWFFMISPGRTGSTIASAILNAHPDVYCANESEFLSRFVFSFKSFFVRPAPPLPLYTWGLCEQMNVNFVRDIMETWRKHVSNKPVFGDKGVYSFYHEDQTRMLDVIFPGCTIILSTRNILDQLCSLLEQRWAGLFIDINAKSKEQLYYSLLKHTSRVLELTDKYRELPNVVELRFEDHLNQENFNTKYQDLFQRLGTTPDQEFLNKQWESCAHVKANDRWKKNDVILGFMDWILENHSHGIALYSRLIKDNKNGK